MKFGIAVTNSVNPVSDGPGQAEYLRKLTPVIESCRFDSIWVSDRTVFPSDLSDRYPEQFGPGFSDPEAQNLLESLSSLSYVAGMTRDIRLGVSVLVLPFRNPVLNAKMLTTLDVLSGGRSIVGIGLGWMVEEFESMGASYAERASVTDEHIEMFQVLCTQDIPEYKGRHFSISGMRFFPKPILHPHPPIWIGGNTDVAIRRAALLGNAWHGINLSPTEVHQKKKTLTSACRNIDRDSGTVSVTMRGIARFDDARFTKNGDRISLTGTKNMILDDIKRFRDSGLDYLVLSVASKNTESTISDVNLIADNVIGNY